MTKTLALIATLTLAALALTDGTTTQGSTTQGTPTQTSDATKPILVSVSSKGNDVRQVLHDLFKQAEKSFVLEPNIRFYLYLSLDKIEFEEALSLICKTSSLKYEVQNGIYFIGPTKSTSASANQTAVKGAFETKPKGKISEMVLSKRVTTRFDKVDIKVLLANLAIQTGVQFEIDPTVPAYKLDAYLINTSLKFALDTVCTATKLQYKFTENQTIAISKTEPVNRVSVVSGGN